MTLRLGHRMAVTTDVHSRGFTATAWTRSVLARKRVFDAAVYRDRTTCRLGRAIRGEEQHRLGHVLGQDRPGEDVPLSIEVLEVVDRDTLRARPLAAHV